MAFSCNVYMINFWFLDVFTNAKSAIKSSELGNIVLYPLLCIENISETIRSALKRDFLAFILFDKCVKAV